MSSEPAARDDAVILLVSMSGDHEIGVDAVQRIAPPLWGRETSEQLIVTTRAGVAEQDAVELHRQW